MLFSWFGNEHRVFFEERSSPPAPFFATQKVRKRLSLNFTISAKKYILFLGMFLPSWTRETQPLNSQSKQILQFCSIEKKKTNSFDLNSCFGWRLRFIRQWLGGSVLGGTERGEAWCFSWVFFCGRELWRLWLEEWFGGGLDGGQEAACDRFLRGQRNVEGQVVISFSWKNLPLVPVFVALLKEPRGSPRVQLSPH